MKIQKGGDGKWSAASLRIFSSQMTHQQITRTLGLIPTRAHTSGDLISPRQATAWREHGWLLSSPLGKDKYPSDTSLLDTRPYLS